MMDIIPESDYTLNILDLEQRTIERNIDHKKELAMDLQQALLMLL
ncbi:MAG: hypothetical protein N4A71_15990 [Carboxylicivirga sp.]|jgi:hypothetical protein|nr:hypothetical protein [Carboxylicivirga sp.]MCT4648431.1 hypothetical protein [Carboxylicivirga sp.]